MGRTPEIRTSRGARRDPSSRRELTARFGEKVRAGDGTGARESPACSPAAGPLGRGGSGVVQAVRPAPDVVDELLDAATKLLEEREACGSAGEAVLEGDEEAAKMLRFESDAAGLVGGEVLGLEEALSDLGEDEAIDDGDAKRLDQVAGEGGAAGMRDMVDADEDVQPEGGDDRLSAGEQQRIAEGEEGVDGVARGPARASGRGEVWWEEGPEGAAPAGGGGAFVSAEGVERGGLLEAAEIGGDLPAEGSEGGVGAAVESPEGVAETCEFFGDEESGLFEAEAFVRTRGMLARQERAGGVRRRLQAAEQLASAGTEKADVNAVPPEQAQHRSGDVRGSVQEDGVELFRMQAEFGTCDGPPAGHAVPHLEGTGADEVGGVGPGFAREGGGRPHGRVLRHLTGDQTSQDDDLALDGSERAAEFEPVARPGL